MDHLARCSEFHYFSATFSLQLLQHYQYKCTIHYVLSYGKLYWHLAANCTDEGLIDNSVQFKIHQISHNLCAYLALIHHGLQDLCELY